MRPLRLPRWYALGLTGIMIGCVLLVPLIFLQRSANNQTSDLNRELLVISGQLTGVEMDIGRERGCKRRLRRRRRRYPRYRRSERRCWAWTRRYRRIWKCSTAAPRRG